MPAGRADIHTRINLILFTTFVLWLHLVAVIVWTGFVLCILVIDSSKWLSEQGASGRPLLPRLLRRFSRVGWEMAGLILLSGLFNLIKHGFQRNFEFAPLYPYLVLAKLILLISMAVFHGTISRRATTAAGAETVNVRLHCVLFLLCAGAAMFLGVGLRNF